MAADTRMEARRLVISRLRNSNRGDGYRASHLQCNCRKGTFEGIQNKYLMDVGYTERDQSQDAPGHVGGDKDVLGPGDGEGGRRGDLEYGICDGVDGVHEVVVLSPEAEIVLHTTDVGTAVAGAVDAE